MRDQYERVIADLEAQAAKLVAVAAELRLAAEAIYPSALPAVTPAGRHRIGAGATNGRKGRGVVAPGGAT